MRHIAIIGSGPAGYYTAEAALKRFDEDVQVDMIDRLPSPYGLIRYGVAPDHQSIKAVSRRYEKTALSDNVRFVGNVEVGRHISVEELSALYDAVVLATGAPHDRRLGIAGEELPGVMGSAAFVGWYNGHPDHAGLQPPLDARQVVVIGNGNVALDVARILAKTPKEFEGSDIVGHALEALTASKVETITILGRRGPHQIAMTPKELGELGQLERAAPHVDATDLPDEGEDEQLEPGQRKSVTHLRSFADSGNGQADKKISINFDFFAAPKAILGDGAVSGIEVERTGLDADGRSRGTGETYRIDCQMVVSCIGYQTPPLGNVPWDEKLGRFSSDEGRIAAGLYCAGWARRGPSGTIGTNRPDGYGIVELIAEDIGEGAGKPGRAGLDELLKQRSVEIVTFRDWKVIEQAESARARDGAPREKFVDVADMIAARQ